MPAHRTTAQSLRKLLQEQLILGSEQLALAGAAEEAIIAGEAERLDGIVRQQQRLSERQAVLESARQQATLELSSRLRGERTATLSALLPAMPPNESAPLEALRQQVLDVEQRMELQNGVNRRLLESAIEYVKFSLDTLTAAALKPARYGINLAQLAAPSFYIDSKA